jgi:transposase
VRLNPPFRDKMEALRNALAAEEASCAALSEELRVLREDHERRSHRLAQRSQRQGLLTRLLSSFEGRAGIGLGRAVPQLRAAKRNQPG